MEIGSGINDGQCSKGKGRCEAHLLQALTNLGLLDQFKQSLYQKVQVSVLSSTPQT